MVYDEREKRITEEITIPGVTGNPEFHVSGVQVDTVWDRLSIIASAEGAFNTNGEDLSGDNILFQYNLKDKKFDWHYNLTVVAKGHFSGFQDLEHDKFGNVYVISTFPTSIVKVSANGVRGSFWYQEPNSNHTIEGFTGIAALHHGDALLVSDGISQQICRLNTEAEKGQPLRVHFDNVSKPLSTRSDGIYLPPLFKGTILLVSDNLLGTIVLRSKDGKWQDAEKLGVINNLYLSEGGWTTATVEIAGRIYAITLFFEDIEPGHTANRTSIPIYDITNSILELL